MLALAAIFPAVAGCDSADDVAQNPGAGTVTILASDAIEATGAIAIYTHGDGGAKTQIRFPIAAERVDPDLYHDVQRIGEGGGVVAVLDSYGSKNGGKRCSNGRESWIRLFSVAQRRLTDSVPVESCLDRLAAGEPPVTWQGESFMVSGTEPRLFRIVEGRAKRDEGHR
ncbi:hypothetical protein [Sphingomonas sp. PB4P5]|uniref:hypothetical protein n=1 Tax=Parasphingomonas puruogangriensis TaxID=3096155 RepID=UPI002FC7EEFB